jgi:hypothetical protein
VGVVELVARSAPSWMRTGSREWGKYAEASNERRCCPPDEDEDEDEEEEDEPLALPIGFRIRTPVVAAPAEASVVVFAA